MDPDLPIWTNPMIFVILLTVAFFITLTINDIIDEHKERKEQSSKFKG